MRKHAQNYARSEYDTQLAKMSFDQTIDLTAGVYILLQCLLDDL